MTDMEKGWQSALRFLRRRLRKADIDIGGTTIRGIGRRSIKVKVPNRRWLQLYVVDDGTMEICDEHIVNDMKVLSRHVNAWEIAAIADANCGVGCYYASGKHVALATSFITFIGDIFNMAEDMHYVAEQMGSGRRRPMCEHCSEELDADGALCSVCSSFPF